MLFQPRQKAVVEAATNEDTSKKRCSSNKRCADPSTDQGNSTKPKKVKI